MCLLILTHFLYTVFMVNASVVELWLVQVSFTPLCSYASDEIHFNLMAIVSDRKKQFEKQIAELEQRKALAAKKVSVCGREEASRRLKLYIYLLLT